MFLKRYEDGLAAYEALTELLLSVFCREMQASLWVEDILRKEVIQPQVPLRLPCYDFTPVTEPTVAGCLLCRLAHHLRVDPIPMV